MFLNSRKSFALLHTIELACINLGVDLNIDFDTDMWGTGKRRKVLYIYISIFISVSLCHCLLSPFLHSIPALQLGPSPSSRKPPCVVILGWPFRGWLENRHNSGYQGLSSNTNHKVEGQGWPCSSVLMANEGIKLHPLSQLQRSLFSQQELSTRTVSGGQLQAAVHWRVATVFKPRPYFP